MERNVAIYARVSTEHEAQLSALENQIEYYDKILKEHPDWKLYKRYIDEGITGTSVNKRKQFLLMLEDAEEGCFDLIITREVSRFARNTVDTLQETRKLKKLGVEVYFTEDNIWTFNDEDGELRLTIMATLAQNESKKTSQRVKAGQMISFHNGVFYGTGNILGYDKVGKDMIINQEQAKTVRFIYDSYLEGYGALKIRYMLEEKGYKTATGLTKWNSESILRILQNPFYSGTIVYRKSYIPDYLEQKPKTNNGAVEQVVVEGRHEPIVSKEEFQRVQEIIKTHNQKLYKSKHGNSGATNIWSKKLICNCKSNFSRKLYHNINGHQTFCYQCYNQKNYGSLNQRKKKGLDIEGACDIPLLQEWKLIIIANKIFDILCNNKDRVLKNAEKKLRNNITNDIDTDDYELKIQNEKILSYKNKISKLLDLYLDEKISQTEYEQKREDLEKLITLCEEKIENFVSKPKENISIEEKLKILENYINDYLYDENGMISERLIDYIIDRIEVKKDKFIVKLRCGDYKNDVLLAKTMITKDDLIEFERKHKDYNKIRLTNSIMVDVYI